MNQARSIGREIGTALAVLAIYLLTVLAPLHHARASQLAFEELGYAAPALGWIRCTPAGAEGGDREILVAKCPAMGAGKVDLALPLLDAAPVRHQAAIASPLPSTIASGVQRSVAPSGGPRAPPVPV